LPTEEEREYACRAGTKTRFSFGNSLENADKYMWWEGNNDPKGTKEVGLRCQIPGDCMICMVAFRSGARPAGYCNAKEILKEILEAPDQARHFSSCG
jgi:hypothetical protein